MQKEKQIISLIKERLKAVEALINDSPIIFRSQSKDFWISEHAKKVFSEHNIDANEFIEWLKIGMKHICNTSYAGLYACIMPLGEILGEEMLVILCDSLCEQGKKFQCSLTAKEMEVLKHLVRGHSNKKIAMSLNISAGTVNAHLDSIYRKLGASNRLQAACIAVKNGIVVPKK